MMGKKKWNSWEHTESAPIAIGGQSQIYLVRNIESQEDKKYILKELINPKRVGRFEQEIDAIKSVTSPHIIEIIDYGFSKEGYYYYVMPYFSETTLEKISKDLKSEVLRCLRIFSKVCKGTKTAHDHEPPIIHRDLKLENILINEEDEIKIIDYGICFLGGQERQTETVEQVGSRILMPPECEAGRSDEIGTHTDIYLLGKVLYAMISGGIRLPRERQNEEKYDLRKTIKDVRVKYIQEIIDACVIEHTHSRIKPVDQLIKGTDKFIELLERGYLPIVYDDDICRFCGRGKLYRIGKFAGSKSRTVQFDPKDIYGWKCDYCGHIHLFDDEIYKKHKKENSEE